MVAVVVGSSRSSSSSGIRVYYYTITYVELQPTPDPRLPTSARVLHTVASAGPKEDEHSGTHEHSELKHRRCCDLGKAQLRPPTTATHLLLPTTTTTITITITA